jgi:hypothetical protein
MLVILYLQIILKLKLVIQNEKQAPSVNEAILFRAD